MYADSLQQVYLDWRNNFISLNSYASYYGLPVEAAQLLIDAARLAHNQMVEITKS